MKIDEQELNKSVCEMEAQTRKMAIQELHRIRTSKKYTISEVSYLTGYPNDTLDRFEIGRRSVSLYVICLLAKIYGKSVRIVFE